MNTVQRIIKNSGASFIARIANPASSFVIVFYIARLFGKDGLGSYSSALALLFIFQAICSLGFPYLITRDVAQEHSVAGSYLMNATFFGSIFSIVCILIMFFTIRLVSNDIVTVRSGYILSFSLIPFTLATVCQSICRGFEKLEYIAIPVLVGNIVKLLAGLYVLLKGYNLYWLMAIITAHHVLIYIIGLWLTIRIMKKEGICTERINFNFCKVIFKNSPIFSLILIFGTVRTNLDVLILNSMMGEKDVGIYSAGNKLINLCGLGIACYIMALQPILFRLYKQSTQKFEKACNESIRFLIIGLLPLVILIITYRIKFIELIFGSEFYASGQVISVIVWTLIFVGMNQIFANTLIASNMQKINFYANLIGMVFSTGLNFILIYFYSYIGAAAAALVSGFITFIYQYLYINIKIHKIQLSVVLIKPLLAAVAMYIVMAKLNITYQTLNIAVGFVVYLSAMTLIKGFNKGDKKYLMKILRPE